MTPSVKMNLVLLILLISLGINVYQLTLLKRCTTECYDMKDSCKMNSCNSSSQQGNPDSSLFCENKGRYDEESTKPEDQKGGEELVAGDALTLIQDYQAEYGKGIYKTTGFLLSKYVFDNIFDNPDRNKNTVRFDLVVKKGQLTLIARGVHTIFTKPKFIEDPSSKHSRMFIAQSWCPSDCLETH